MLRVFPNGFQITFENGYTVSVMFDERNYCSNRNSNLYTRGECANAEVAIFRPNGSTLPIDGDVAGWASPERVAQLIEFTASLSSPEEMAMLDRIDFYFDQYTDEEYWQMEVENTIDDLEADWYDNECGTGSDPDRF